jgi:hypothetical protein
MSKLPYIQFYPADWRKDPGVQSLSFHDRGVWFEILCLMHESEQRGKLLLNGKPMPEEALARLLGLDKQNLTKTLTTLVDYGVVSRDGDGALNNRRMVRDDELRKIRQEAGKLGGNPALLNQNGSKIPKEVKQKTTLSETETENKDRIIVSTNGYHNPARAREPAAAAVSKFTEDTCREYVDFMAQNGRAIKNPGGLAHTIYESGKNDGDIEAWLKAGKRKPHVPRKAEIPG